MRYKGKEVDLSECRTKIDVLEALLGEHVRQEIKEGKACIHSFISSNTYLCLNLHKTDSLKDCPSIFVNLKEVPLIRERVIKVTKAYIKFTNDEILVSEGVIEKEIDSIDFIKENDDISYETSCIVPRDLWKL